MGCTSCRAVLPFYYAKLPVSGNGFSSLNLTAAPSLPATVIFGNTQFQTSNLMRSVPTAAVSFESSGRSFSNAGDVNGDGRDDVVMGVPFAARAYVMYGTAAGGFKNMVKGFVISGKSGDQAGWAVDAAGDFNGDGFGDIVIGAPSTSFNSKLSCGAVYVIYGKAKESPNVDLQAVRAEQGVVVYGGATQEYFGISVAGVGDVKGDVVVGGIKAQSVYTGSVTVLYGGQQAALNGKTSSLLPSSAASTYSGSQFTWLGYMVAAAGDVNGDGIDDFIAGSLPWSSRFNQQFAAVFLGAHDGSSRSISPARTIYGSGGVVVSGTGDVNVDGFDDLLLADTTTFPSGAFVVHRVNAVYTASPTLAPSRNPSIVPTAAPTAVPTSGRPSLLPTAPTTAPTAVPTGPSVEPTVAPTQPSISPTEAPSTSPTCSPSVAPTTTVPSSPPTEEPSLAPLSASPTEAPVAPSASPTNTTQSTVEPSKAPTTAAPSKRSSSRKGQPSRYPSAAPSIATMPVHVENATVVISVGGTVARVAEATTYIINTPSDVEVVGTQGNSTFVITPVSAVTYSFDYFDNATDVFDLSEFTTIHSFQALTITRGSIVINLPYNQKIHIVNLEPGDLRAENFIFCEKPPVYFPLITVGGLLGGFAVVYAVLMVFKKELLKHAKKMAQKSGSMLRMGNQRHSTLVPIKDTAALNEAIAAARARLESIDEEKAMPVEDEEAEEAHVQRRALKAAARRALSISLPPSVVQTAADVEKTAIIAVPHQPRRSKKRANSIDREMSTQTMCDMGTQTADNVERKEGDADACREVQETVSRRTNRFNYSDADAAGMSSPKVHHSSSSAMSGLDAIYGGRISAELHPSMGSARFLWNSSGPHQLSLEAYHAMQQQIWQQQFLLQQQFDQQRISSRHSYSTTGRWLHQR